MTDQTQQSRTETGGFNWERAAACTLCIGAGVLALRLFFRYLLGVLMPFALAYLLARLLRPAVDFLTGGRRRQTASTRAGRRVLSATLVVLFTGLVVWLTVAGVRRGVGELENLLLRLQDVLADGDGQADGAPGFSARWTIYGLFRSICPSSGGLNPRRAFRGSATGWTAPSGRWCRILSAA